MGHCNFTPACNVDPASSGVKTNPTREGPCFSPLRLHITSRFAPPSDPCDLPGTVSQPTANRFPRAHTRGSLQAYVARGNPASFCEQREGGSDSFVDGGGDVSPFDRDADVILTGVGYHF
ncbi:MAG: hypothetical protein A4E63_03084 [Syntrophorhabdus sp. PtaU1.Bin050]|nr:MAG: hypothetical protein A4E63_03084 [Syntrophorhabdus sp. PtaU1.Bin050]